MNSALGDSSNPLNLVPFDRQENDPDALIRVIGKGSIGGKAQGLVLLHQLLSTSSLIGDFPQIKFSVPGFTVIATDVFDGFLEKGHLIKYLSQEHTDDQIAHGFQQAELPFFILGDLQTLVQDIRSPLAVRSSSLLEDATYEPFAGIYETKMIPNHQFDADLRFRKVSEAIKLVYASTFFRAAKSYREATGHADRDEKMAVILQNVHGNRHHVRFYPELSGVARSYNYYPVGRAKPEDGVVTLALGLGKTIVDGGICWSYSPRYPRVSPPYGSTSDLLKNSQKEFWAVNMGTPLVYDPIRETEYLVQDDLSTAERDGSLRYLCSTYDPHADRLQIGMAGVGPRALTFSPLLQLKEIPFNEAIQALLGLCEKELEKPVEIEFAMTFSPPSLGLLQVRPMVISRERVEVNDQDLVHPRLLACTEKALGNGVIADIQDIVYVIPDQFKIEDTRSISAELEEINSKLLDQKWPYLLIVFGRLGSSDPWLGIPVNWGQISGTRIIIETYQQDFCPDMSQGSHFFHNLTSLGVSYFSIPRSGRCHIDWDWLERQNETHRTEHIRHLRLPSPLEIRVDGRSGRGVVIKNSE
jgi:hypothetical protein